MKTHGAILVLAMAGYDPSHTISFWERMLKYSDSPDIPEFLSTHPSHDARIEAAREYLPEAMTYYNRRETGNR